MKWFLKDYHLPENLEILFMLTLGILLQMVDGSPLSLKERWMLVWATELPAEYFSPFVQRFIKTLLSIIVAVRCATTYAYVVSATLVIFCIVKDTTPKLMLLWLLVSGIKSVSMTFLEALTGVYVCSAFGKIRKACIEFFISKALEIIFAAYLWGNVLNIYQEMERKAEQKGLLQSKDQSFFQRGDFGRQRTRSLVDESTLYKTACLNKFEFKDVPQIILQMLRDDEMSQDSLLGPEMMLASVSNMGSCDDLKLSESLGELGFMDLRNTQIIGLEEDENLSPQEKALKFLKLTNSDVKRIKMNKTYLDNDIFKIDDKTWKNVMESGTRLNKPKQARAQIFIRDISQQEVGGETSSREKLQKKSADFKFGFSFSNLFFNEKQFSCDEEDDEILTVNLEEENGKEDEETVGMFMSNIKEGTVVHRNSLGFAFIRKMKGNAYQQLYKQEFMSVIGPEVFDKATKLPKVTSLTRVDRKTDARPSTSLPDILKSQHNRRNLSLEDFKQKRSSLMEKDQPDKPFDETSVPAEQEKFFREKTEEIQEIKETKKNDLVEEKTVVEPPSALDTYSKNHPSETEDDISDDSKHLKVRFKTSLPLIKLAEETSSFETEDSVSDDSECVTPKTLRIQIKTKTSVPSVERKLPEYRKPSRSRRITIRRVKRMGKATKSTPSPPSDSNQSLKTSDDVIDLKPVKNREEAPKEENSEESSNSDTSNSSRNSKHPNNKKDLSVNEKQIYFFTELLQKPFADVLLTYYDLKKRVHVQRKSSLNKKRSNDIFQTLKILQMLENESKETKMWKSKVFKMAEIYTRQKNLSKSFVKRESILRKLIYYEILQYNRRNLQKLISMNKWNWPCSSDESTNIECARSDFSFTSKSRSGPNLKSGSPVVEESTTSACRENTLDGKTETNESDENEKMSSAERQIGKTAEGKEKFNMARKPSEVLGSEGESLCSQESDEPISLYYSKAANLASPLLDMKRFIYPDHIHYSYKHVKKKGFDVDISGGFPLLVRESLMSPVKMGAKAKSIPPEFEITRRPMDLSFATTNAFAEWQNNDQNDLAVSEKKFNANSSEADLTKNKNMKKPKRPRKNSDKSDSRSSFKNEPKPKSFDSNLNKLKYLYAAKDFILIEKLLKMHMRLNGNDGARENVGTRRSPVQISSTQLHSNKGRINSTYNPAISLQENKSRNEKKKIETQEKRTKDMFARLEREALLQNKNLQKSFGPSRT